MPDNANDPSVSEGTGPENPSKSSEIASPSDPAPPAEVVGRAVRKLAENNPGQAGEVIREFMAFGMGPTMNPLHSKLNSEHITTVLNIAEKHDERAYSLQSKELDLEATNRNYAFGVFLIGIIAFIVLVVIFKNDKEILIPLVTGLLSFAAGVGGGYGYARSRESE